MADIHFEMSQKSIQDIVSLFEKRFLNLNPGFQRKSVWNTNDRNKLIDSILKNYPLPSIFLYRRKESGEIVYDVIDGKQRIESILMYMGKMRGNQFAIKFQLDSEEKYETVDWKYLKKKELNHKLTGYKLQIIEVEGNLSTIIELFVRINSTGKALSGAEKHNAKYYKSNFLKTSAKLARRFESYLLTTGVLSRGQISRMKHIELLCELMLAADKGDVSNRKAALDRVMSSESITGKQLLKAELLTQKSLRRLKTMFPKLKELRFKQISDFYTLAVLIQKFETERLILTDKKKNLEAWELLKRFAIGVDEVGLQLKAGKSIKLGQELFREYLTTVQRTTDEISQRQKRELLLRGLLENLFQQKDSDRLFSTEQRRLIWNNTTEKKCSVCGEVLTWSNFTIDHINPHSKGGRTDLKNAALMCRKHNSAKGNRKKR